MIHHQHEQGSPEWLAARRGCITGSRFKMARDRSDGLTKQQATYVDAMRSGKDQAAAMAAAGYKKAPSFDALEKALAGKLEKQWGTKALCYAYDTARERCGGQAQAPFQNYAMRMGTEQESPARRAYEAKTGNLVEEVGFFTTEDGLFGLSPDGLIDDDGVLEIKTMVSSDTLFTAVAQGDVSEYLDQCLGYLWLLGRQWVDLVLWVPDLQHMTIRRITRDEEAIAALEADLIEFAALVREQEALLRKALGMGAGEQRDEVDSHQPAAAPAPTPAPMPAPTAAPTANVVPMPTKAPAPAAVPSPANYEWQTADSLPPEPGDWIDVQQVVTYRFHPYKPASQEARRGIRGRWQHHNGYGWENCEKPAGPWRVAAAVRNEQKAAT